MNQAIQDFIQCKRLAIAGASRSGQKFGNIAAKELQGRGYQVYLVHPEAKEIDGLPCYPNLAALQGQVDAVLISVPPTQGEAVLREAAQVGVKHIWIQQQAESPQLLSVAQSLGVTPVTGKCILMYATPVHGFHGFHRAVVKLFGQL